MAQLKAEWLRLDNKARFVECIIKGELVVQGRRKTDIVLDLKRLGFEPEQATEKDDQNTTIAEEASDIKGLSTKTGYEYLLSMPIHSLTKERVDELRAQVTEKKTILEQLIGKTPLDLWRADLDVFEQVWHDYLRVEEQKERDQQTQHAKRQAQQQGTKKRVAAPKKTKKIKGGVDDEEDTAEEDDNLNDFIVNDLEDERVGAVKKTKKNAAKTTNVAIDHSKTAAPKAPQTHFVKTKTTESAFNAPPLVSTVNNVDDLMSLPLAERISRMLSNRMQSNNNNPSSTSSISVPHVPLATTSVNRTALLDEKTTPTVTKDQSITSALFGKPGTKKPPITKKKASMEEIGKKTGAVAKNPVPKKAASSGPIITTAISSGNIDKEKSSILSTTNTTRPKRTTTKNTASKSKVVSFSSDENPDDDDAYVMTEDDSEEEEEDEAYEDE